MRVQCVQSHVCDVVGGSNQVVLPGAVGSLTYRSNLARDRCHIHWLSGYQGEYSVDEAVAVTDAKRRAVLKVLQSKYPWLYAYSGEGECVGIGPTNPTEDYPRYSYDDLRELARELKGWVMQRDDGFSPAFTLHNFKEPADGGDKEAE